MKEQTALELYRKIGNVEHLDSVYQGLVGSPENWHYRNKMEYSFSAIVHNPESGEKEDRFGLGFKRRGTWWAVEDLNRDSGLFDADVENALPQLRAWFESTGCPLGIHRDAKASSASWWCEKASLPNGCSSTW